MKKAPWYDDEVKQLSRIHAIPEAEAGKLLNNLVAGHKKANKCTTKRAWEIYNTDRCYRIDRDFFIETMMNEYGKTREQAEAMADGCVPYF